MNGIPAEWREELAGYQPGERTLPSPDRVPPAARLGMDLDVYQRAREALGMSDRQVAASLGLTTKELRLWQTTAPGGLNRLALARLLGVEQATLWVCR